MPIFLLETIFMKVTCFITSKAIEVSTSTLHLSYNLDIMTDTGFKRREYGPLSCIGLIVFSLTLLPLSIVQCLTVSLLKICIDNVWKDKGPNIGNSRTVLVNGGRMQKCIYVIRALARQGYRVILVEQSGWG